jgi:hypothetical protein
LKFGVGGLGFGVWGLGFGVWGLGFGVWGLGFGVWGLGFGYQGVGLRVKDVSRMVQGLPPDGASTAARAHTWYSVLGSGFRVQGSRFSDQVSSRPG